jgi:hypothetical protein
MTKKYNLYVLMYLNFDDENKIISFFEDKFNIPTNNIVRGMHITLYHSLIPINLPIKDKNIISIDVDVEETRFMVMVPGGENVKENILPSSKGIGIRLTKRNIAISKILEIRRNIYQNEPILKTRKNTSDWKNAFGAKNFQPHMTLLKPGNNIPSDLTEVGNLFRKNFKQLNFKKLIIKKYLKNS